MASAAAASAKRATLAKGKFAVHPLLPGVANLAAKACIGRVKPAWAPTAQDLLQRWGEIAPCMKHYADFRSKTKARDLKKQHVFMNEKASAELARFYLCCAVRIRREEVDACGEDNQKLLELAGKVATEIVEPFFDDCREFIKGYDVNLHRALDETTVWYEVDEALFWHKSFEAGAADEYAAFIEEALREDWPEAGDTAGVDRALETLGAAVAENGALRPGAEKVFAAFLDASVMPAKCSIRTALIDHGIAWGDVEYRPE